MEKNVEAMRQEMVKQQLFIQRLMEDGLKLQQELAELKAKKS